MFRFSDFKDEAVAQPLVGEFDLFSVDKFLAEEPVFITDSISVESVPKRSCAIEETGSEPS